MCAGEKHSAYAFYSIKNCFYFMHMSVCLACVYVHYVQVWCPWRPEEGIGSPDAEVKDCCELLCWCWELNQGPL